MITISVVMPVLNSARFLREALASIHAQTRAPLEILVIDGPSTDETPQIARAHPNVQYHRQTGKGMWNALNEGIAMAQGDAIAFLSSDDLWHPDKLRLQAEWLQAHSETACVFCHAQLQAMEMGSRLESSKPELFRQPQPSYMTEAMLARKSVFVQLGGFVESYTINGDIDWFARMFDANIATHMLSEVLLTRRFHATNLSTAVSSAAQYNSEMLSAIRQKILRARNEVAPE